MEPKSAPKKQMQNIHVDSVEELLDFLPEDQLKITEYLRKLVFECVPDIREKISFNVPYYERYRSMFFIWPGAVSWESITHEGVRFGFQWGCLLQDDSGYLDRGKRKQVFWRDFYSLADIDVEVLKALIYEAVMVDDAKRVKGKEKK